MVPTVVLPFATRSILDVFIYFLNSISTMRQAAALLSLGLLALTSAVSGATFPSSDLVAPLLLWSNKALIGNGNGAQVSYEVRVTAGSTL